MPNLSKPGTWWKNCRSLIYTSSLILPVRERNRILREIATLKKSAFMKSFVGMAVSAITLNVFDRGYTKALTDNYLPLRLEGFHAPNSWTRATITGVTDGT